MGRYHFRYKEGKAYPSDVYSSDDEYFADLAKAYQTELDILYKAGLRNAQVDDPNLACKLHLYSKRRPSLTDIFRLLRR